MQRKLDGKEFWISYNTSLQLVAAEVAVLIFQLYSRGPIMIFARLVLLVLTGVLLAMAMVFLFRHFTEANAVRNILLAFIAIIDAKILLKVIHHMGDGSPVDPIVQLPLMGTGGTIILMAYFVLVNMFLVTIALSL
jgi:hypothetical protein